MRGELSLRPRTKIFVCVNVFVQLLRKGVKFGGAARAKRLERESQFAVRTKNVGIMFDELGCVRKSLCAFDSAYLSSAKLIFLWEYSKINKAYINVALLDQFSIV